MRKITMAMLDAMAKRQNWHQSNTRVQIEGDFIQVYLHNSLIYEGNPSEDVNKMDNDVFFRFDNHNWKTPTTKDRLSAILWKFHGLNLYQKDFVWYISGEMTHGKALNFDKLKKKWLNPSFLRSLSAKNLI